MKPSFTPVFSKNSSLYLLRTSISTLMSISLNVVSMAAVFCASFSRLAIVCRMRLIGTRRTPRPLPAGAGTDGADDGLLGAEDEVDDWGLAAEDEAAGCSTCLEPGWLVDLLWCCAPL